MNNPQKTASISSLTKNRERGTKLRTRRNAQTMSPKKPFKCSIFTIKEHFSQKKPVWFTS